MTTPEASTAATGEGPPRELTIAARKLEREVLGDPIAVGQRTVQPVARLAGWYDGDSNAQGGVAWAWIRLTPTVAVVREADGAERRVLIFDATAAALRGMGITALVILVVSWLIGSIARRASRARSEGGQR